MTVARTHCVALLGIEGRMVEVEADIANGIPGFVLVGLPDATLNEARDRVRSALVNSGEGWPQRRRTVSLSPADLPKKGSHFDVAIAVAVAAAAGTVPPSALEGVVFLGELGLDGRARAVPGVLPAVLASSRCGFTRVVVPEANAAEATLLPEMAVIGIRSLRQLLALLRGDLVPDEPPEAPVDEIASEPARPRLALDMADVVGQMTARAAAEVAAAGMHHMMMVGPPGSGKTMIAERLPGLLPDLDAEEALEVTAVHSLAGLLRPGQPLVTTPPFADPHHTASVAAMVGGGSGVARPGAVSQSHRGVLFMDEAPQFGVRVIDALREPLEKGEVLMARSQRSIRFPARFLLVMAANPCPCGYFGQREQPCHCLPDSVRRYEQRISGPVRDRIDLWVNVPAVQRAILLAGLGLMESTATIAERVAEARLRQRRRYAGLPWRCNGEVPGPEFRRRWPLPADVLDPVEQALRQGELTARGAHRSIRVAWTAADLAGRDRPIADDTAYAVAQHLETRVAA